MFRFRVIAAGLVCLVIAGCGPGGPKVYPVKGKLTAEGQPLENVNVTFNPSDSSLPIGTGRTKSDGTYELSSGVQGHPGVVPGKYKITLQQVVGGGKEEAMKSYGSKEGGRGSAAPKVESKIPKEYTSLQTTTKEVEVTAGDNNINIEL